ncbi:MAG TPA: helix-turn-helix domain-containing protein [Actinomycetota bacterium]
MRSPPEQLLTTQQVAELLQIPVATLHRWAYLGDGPAFARVGKHRRYRWDDLDAWIQTRVRNPGSRDHAPRRWYRPPDRSRGASRNQAPHA